MLVIWQWRSFACEMRSCLKAFLLCHQLCDGGGCRKLSWEAATERFLRAGRIEEREWPWLAVDAAGGLFWSAYSAVIGAVTSTAWPVCRVPHYMSIILNDSQGGGSGFWGFGMVSHLAFIKSTMTWLDQFKITSGAQALSHCAG